MILNAFAGMPVLGGGGMKMASVELGRYLAILWLVDNDQFQPKVFKWKSVLHVFRFETLCFPLHIQTNEIRVSHGSCRSDDEGDWRLEPPTGSGWGHCRTSRHYSPFPGRVRKRVGMRFV